MGKTVTDYRKLANQLEKRNEELVEDNYELRSSVEELEGELKKLKGLNYQLEHSLRDFKDKYLYATGMLAVLKRVSSLYGEEKPTHDEFFQNERGRYREILSEVDLPF